MNTLTTKPPGLGALLITAATLMMFNPSSLHAQQSPASSPLPMGQSQPARSPQDDETPENRPNAIDRFNDSADHTAKSAGQSMSDAWITTKVKSQLLTDSRIKDSSIQVTTQNGIVSLSGTAASYYIAQRAEEDASQVVGVKSVDQSMLKVRQ